MDTLIASAIAFAITLYFVRRYLKKMGARKETGDAPALPVAAGACPRCAKPVAPGASFCAGCGAPLELWKVHRASVAESSGEDGEQKEAKPRPVINATLCIGCGSCLDACPEEGTLALVGGKAILANPASCVGHAGCVDACPTSGITLAFGDKLQTLSVPFVKEDFETNVPGVFIVGELGGMGLIKTAINEGCMAIDHIHKRLQNETAKPTNGNGNGAGLTGGTTPEHPVDVIVVGAGPAGLSASLSALQRGLSYLTFDQAEVASTIRQYPRHKFLMAEPVSMPLYGNLYIADGTKEALLSVWENILDNTGVQVRTNEGVEDFHRQDSALQVKTARGLYYAKYVVLAMGKRGTPRRLEIPGATQAKVTYRLIEAEGYKGRDILVVGGGDSAIEAALALSRNRRNNVTLSYRKTDFARARDRNRKALLSAENEQLLRICRASEVSEVTADSVLLSCPDGPLQLPNEFVFVMIGGNSPEGFLRKTGIEIVEKVVST